MPKSNILRSAAVAVAALAALLAAGAANAGTLAGAVPEWESMPSALTVQPDSTVTVDVIGRDTDGSDLEFFINYTIAGACTHPAVPGGPAFQDDTGLTPFEGVVLNAGVPRRERATLTIHTKPGVAAGQYCLRLMVADADSGVARIASIVIADSAPIAAIDSYATDEDVTLTTPAPGVLANDTDANGDPLTAELVVGPTHGALSLAPDGSFQYVPAANFNGTDEFTYRALDPKGNASKPAKVTLSVKPVSDRPEWESMPSALTIQPDSTLTVDVIGRDADGSDLEFFINFTIAGACTNPAVPGGPVFQDDTGLTPFEGVVLDGSVPRREQATLKLHTKPGVAAGEYCLRLMVADADSGVAKIVTITVAPPTPPEDTSAPTCVIVAQGTTTAGNAFIKFRVNDVGTGLASHKVTYLRNASVAVDAYLPGSLGPVYVKATAVDKTKSLGVQVDFVDRAGNVGICDPIVLSVVRQNEKLQDETFYNVAQAESRVSIYNGEPGMKKVVIIVNGKKFKERNLRANEVRKFDVSAAMMPGATNTITVRVQGKKGASALIVIADIP